MIFRIRYKKLGGHYHCRMFSAKAKDMTFAKLGEVVFDESEFEAAKEAMVGVEFIDDGKPEET